MISIDEYSPGPYLSQFVQSYWQGNFNISGVSKISHSVLPSGCIELIIHVTVDHCLLSSNSENWESSPKFTLLGLYEKPYVVQFEKPVRVFGIRFFPDGFRHVFGVPPREFLASYEDCIAVLGQKLSNFCSDIQSAKVTEQRIAIANAFLLKTLSASRIKYDYTHQAMMLVRRTTGIADYKELVSQIPISTRQLQREFRKIYGLSIRDYIRLTRMNAIYKYMLSGTSDLGQLTFEMEFFDQSHFIREFRNYTGVPPRRFLAFSEDYIVNPK